MDPDIHALPVPLADHRIFYGQGPCQFGDLWLPESAGHSLLPVVVFFHGGWWKSKYDLGYGGHLCKALKQQGIACWSVEYRRTGETDGGWPATFLDAAAGCDFVARLAEDYPLDLKRVIAMGHSAGGHLAFWIAGRQNIQRASVLAPAKAPLPLRATIGLAGAVDLRMLIDLSGGGIFAHDRDEVYRLMGGTPAEYPGRYQAGNPGDLLPFAAKQVLIQGTEDDQIPPELPTRWQELSRRYGSEATVSILPNLDHSDVVDPRTPAWPRVLAHVRALI